MSEVNIEKWVTLKEVQSYLGVGRETVLAWIAKRNMPAYKVGRLGSSSCPRWTIGFVPAVPPMTETMKKLTRTANKSVLWDNTKKYNEDGYIQFTAGG